MSAASKRGARREHAAAALVGSVRVRREIGTSAPDVEPSELPNGVAIIVESKSRKSPLRVVERWLSQAEGYGPGRAAVVVVYALGQPAGEALVIMRAAQWRQAVGLEEPDAQRVLPLGVPR